MRILAALFLSMAIASCEAPSTTPTQTQAELSVSQEWAAPTPAGVDVSAGYMTISNGTAAEDRLLSATSPRADRVEIHEMSMDGAVMRMRPVETLSIAPGQEVELAPGSMHLMFYGVSEPFAEGQDIPLQLTFATAGTIDVSLPVRRGAPDGHGAH